MKILITGASGSGTTTLGKALAQELNINHLDSDDFFWLPTNPPYTERRTTNERLEMIQAELEKHEHTVVSGSVMGWGELLENAFDLIIFLYLETEIRIARLKVREQEEVGFVNPEFIEWAASYDTGPEEGRSLAKHRKWLSERNAVILKIEGDLSVKERIERVKSSILKLAAC